MAKEADMVTDIRASKMFRLLDEGESVAKIARRLEMSEKTIRKYRDADVLPSQLERPQRTYRTREDPLAKYWEEIEQLLQNDRRLKPYAILDWLKQKYNPPGGEPRVTDSIRRTLERRIRRWKLQHGVEQEVTFPQIHHPGDVIAFDFVRMNSLKVTLGGKPFEHLLFHAVLTYSNWEYVHLCHSESFEALSAGLQDALHRAGGVPQRVRSDSLSAAVNNLSDDKEFATAYRELLKHYGVKGHRINVRKPHENGDVESLHGHLKDALDQALRLRGSRDFSNASDYMAFVQHVVQRSNASREKRLAEERAVLGPLPPQRRSTCTSISLTVRSDSVIRVKRNVYSVSSKYVDLRLEVRIYQDHLELWYQNEFVERMPRLFGHGKEAIDFRHVIDSLVRKPGAFINYKYVQHMFPTTRFRLAYDQLLQNTTEASAVKQYLKLLYAAKHEGLDLVDDALRWFLTTGQALHADAVLKAVAANGQLPAPTAVAVDAPDLSVFDSLLQHKDVYDDQETSDFPPQTTNDADDGQLAAYDRHVEAAGSTQGVAPTNTPRDPLVDGRASGTRTLDAHAVLGGAGRQGMSSKTPESHSAFDAQCQFVSGQDLGSIELVSVAPACHATIRDTSSRRLLGSPRQLADLWKTRIGKNDVAVGTRGSAGEARSCGLLLDLPDVGPGVAASQTRPEAGACHQEAPEVRSLDHRRSGLCAAESGGDGSTVHAAVGTIRTRQRTDQLEPAVLKMGTDIQRPDDHGGGDRPTDPSLRDHRAQQGPQLSPRRSQEKATRFNRWCGGLTRLFSLGTSNCR